MRAICHPGWCLAHTLQQPKTAGPPTSPISPDFHSKIESGMPPEVSKHSKTSILAKSYHNLGGKSNELYASPWLIRWYLSVLVLYTTCAFAAIAWALSGPAVSGQRRVLRTGSTPVSQFYAGLALSAILAPAAMVLRLSTAELSSMHPFALASRKAIQISDLDLIMDPGVFALRAMLRYSTWYSLVQAILLLGGFLLVPVGTLILTIDNYAPQSLRQDVVGIQAMRGNPYALSTSMGGTVGSNAALRFGTDDRVLPVLTNAMRGIALTLPTSVDATPGVLGPTSTLNITFQPNVQYHGVVAFHWSGNCLPADEEIGITWDGKSSNITFTFPDGSQDSAYSSNISTAIMWSNATQWTDSGIPLDGYTYAVQVGPDQFVGPPVGRGDVDYTQVRDGLLHKDGVWISRAKCKPSLTWEVSSCTWTGSMMDDCVNAPGTNTTELDIPGLDALSGYMTAMFWGEQVKQSPLFVHAYQVFAYTYLDYNVIFGINALAISQITSAGYFGTAMVPTTGQVAAPVYIVRLPVLICVAFLLLLVVCLISADLILASKQQVPTRKTSFLTIAAAVRGRWWDDELYGKCTLGRSSLRSRSTEAKVQFGVDADNPEHIGLAPEVRPILKDEVYY
jgi:hypothetical protein